MAKRDKADAAPEHVVVIALFPNPDAAAQAARQLQDAEFTKEQIGAIMPKGAAATESAPKLIVGEDLEVEAEATKTGAATGGIMGALLGLIGSLLIPGLGAVTLGGVLVSTLIGAGVGTVTGGLVGMLVGMGASQAEAEYFERALRAGGTLLTVQPGRARADEAREILQDAGADLGPSSESVSLPSASVRSGTEKDAWRGNERRYRKDADFRGPDRRKVRV